MTASPFDRYCRKKVGQYNYRQICLGQKPQFKEV